MLRNVATETHEDFSEPVLPGPGGSDYERYLRTDELLALQKGPGEWVHRDELLFQTVHQSSEIWLKLCWNEMEEACVHLERAELAAALRLLRRSTEALKIVTGLLDQLEHLDPWEYQVVRRVLGHGSGFDSPGFREIRRVAPRLGQAFHKLRREAGLTVVELYQQGRRHEELYQLAEQLIEIDERISVWRFRHFKVITRVIGEGAIGTQGTPVDLLGGLIKQKIFPELWDARTELTELAKLED
jgi:tryptophan 2,3-dioxygenase